MPCIHCRLITSGCRSVGFTSIANVQGLYHHFLYAAFTNHTRECSLDCAFWKIYSFWLQCRKEMELYKTSLSHSRRILMCFCDFWYASRYYHSTCVLPHWLKAPMKLNTLAHLNSVQNLSMLWTIDSDICWTSSFRLLTIVSLSVKPAIRIWNIF